MNIHDITSTSTKGGEIPYFNGNYLSTLNAGTTGYFLMTNGEGTAPSWEAISGGLPAALTKVDDINVTLTLTGTPSIALLQATGLTLGWTGTLDDSRITSSATWNAKQSAITLGTNLQYFKGDLSLGTFPTDNTSFTNGAGYLTSLTGAVLTSRTLNINGTIQDLSANRTWTVGDLIAANNLSDISNSTTARTNLGLGTLATQSGTFSGTSSGTNTGDQTIILTGAVTGSGTGSFATTLASGIDATKINTGVVSNTEFNYLDGVTSAIQTQINTKQATITTGTTAQYIKGDLSLGTTPTTSYSFMQGNPNSTVPSSVTRYSGFGGSPMASGEANVKITVNYACTLSQFYLHTTTTQPASGSLTIAIRKNGSDTALTFVISAGTAANTFSDLTHSVTFAAGDDISIGFINAATAASASVAGLSVLVATTIV